MALGWSQGTLNIATNVRGWSQCVWAPELSLFIAVASTAFSGASVNRAATSPDGVTWTAHALTGNTWQGVAWNGSIAVTVSSDATNRVMTSTDGATWTGRSASEANFWSAVCWDSGHSVFVAVAQTGTHRVMTSPDGITWTNQTASSAKSWSAIAYSSSLNMLVATAQTFGTTSVMTSTDGGVTWSDQTTPVSTTPQQNSIVWSPDLAMFAIGCSGPHVLTSTNGTTWTDRGDVASGNTVLSLAWAHELNLFIAITGSTSYATSPDGVTWTLATMSDGVNNYTHSWRSVAFSNAISAFVILLGADSAGVTALGHAQSLGPSSTAQGPANGGNTVTFFGDGRNGGFINGGGHTYDAFIGDLSTYATQLASGTAPLGLLALTASSVTFVSAFKMTGAAPHGKGVSDVAIVDQSLSTNNVVFYMAGGYTFINPAIVSVLPVTGINTGGTALTVTGTNMFSSAFGAPGNLYAVFSDGTTKLCTSPVQVNATTYTCVTPAYDPNAALLVDLRYDPPLLSTFLPTTFFSYPSSTLVGAFTFKIPIEADTGSNFAGLASYDLSGTFASYNDGPTLAGAAVLTPAGSGKNAGSGYLDNPITVPSPPAPINGGASKQGNASGLWWGLQRVEVKPRDEGHK